MKKWFCVLLTAALLLTFAPLSGFAAVDRPEIDFGGLFTPRASAATIIDSGNCGFEGWDDSNGQEIHDGEKVKYTLDSDGVLTVRGSGRMAGWGDGGAPWYNNRSSVKTVVIEPGVTSIGSCAFYNCNSLTAVTIPDSVTSIGEWAFCNCTRLTTVTIPDSVTSIGSRAFQYCTSLTNVTIPDSVTSIGRYAFYNCTGLTNVTIGNSVTSIGDSAFRDCRSLTNVTIPDSVTGISDNAFEEGTIHILCKKNSAAHKYAEDKGYAYGLTDVPASEQTISGKVGILNWSLDKLNCVLTVSSSAGMPSFAASDAPWKAYSPYVQTAVIKDGTTSISDKAFYECRSLTGVTIPDSVTSIGDYAFYYCTRLTGVTIPDSVTSIGDYAFSSCYSLTGVTIPDSVTSIGNYAFAMYDKEKMGYYESKLSSVIIGNGVTSIGSYAFYNCNSLTGVTIPDSVTSIGIEAFSNCASLTNVTIPDSVTSIGESPFSGCTGLKSAVIGSGVTSLNGAFFGCSSLESVVLGKNVQSIGPYAFSGCKMLPAVTLPAGVSSLGSQAFADCDSLEKLYILNGNCSITNDAIPANTALYAAAGSNVETFAKKNGYLFNESNGIHKHSFQTTETVKATCVDQGYVRKACSCGEVRYDFTDPTGVHTPGDPVETVTKQGDCLHDGTKKVTVSCAVCGAVISEKEETVKGEGHKLTEITAKAATCTEDGHIAHYLCAVCKKTFSDGEGKKELADVTVKATGHNMMKTEAVPVTCTENGSVEYYTCSVCGKKFSDEKGTEEIADATVYAQGHKISKGGAAPSLFDGFGGITVYTCAVCGRVFGDLTDAYLTAGDVDGDEKISSADARLALRASVKLERYIEGSAPYLAADVNKDGNIGSDDARMILRASVKLETLA